MIFIRYCSFNFWVDGLQKFNIDESFYVTSDRSNSTSIMQAFKNTIGSEKCSFSGNINDGFQLNIDVGEWFVFEAFFNWLILLLKCSKWC